MSATHRRQLDKRGNVGAEKLLSMAMDGCEYDSTYSLQTRTGNLRSRLRLTIERLAYLAPPNAVWQKCSVGPASPWYRLVSAW